MSNAVAMSSFLHELASECHMHNCLHCYSQLNPALASDPNMQDDHVIDESMGSLWRLFEAEH